MEARELRIGNLLENYFGVVEVFGVSKDIIQFNYKDEIYYEDHNSLKPIQLTEEWLLKFGFVKKLGDYELENFRFKVNKPMNYDGFLFCEGYSVITDKIHFVHQLQNLYFALTNQELAIKTETK